MGVPMAPYGPPVSIPPSYVPPQTQKMPEIPGPDNTECNYIVMLFVAGLLLLSLSESKKGKA